jgi:hypothetical protein
LVGVLGAGVAVPLLAPSAHLLNLLCLALHYVLRQITQFGPAGVRDHVLRREYRHGVVWDHAVDELPVEGLVLLEGAS